MVKARDALKVSIPEFATPGSLDLRAIQRAIDGIRDGLAQLKASVDALQTKSNATGDVSTLKAQVGQLIGAVSSLQAVATSIAEPELEGVAVDTTARALIAQLSARLDSLEQGLNP